MLGITDEILHGFDENKCTIMIFLDLSAAFDTIDTDTLLQILHDEIGVDGIALEWFRSFLTGRTQRVKIQDEYSQSCEVPFGVPQGSVLGPKIFNVNVRSQPRVFVRCTFKSSSFADDSNGRKTFSLLFQYEVLKNEIGNCMNEMILWMNDHYMKINPDKTEILLLYPSSLEKEVKIKGVIIDEKCIRFSNEVKNVGVWLDTNLTMDKHVNSVVSHCYKLLKDIGRIRKYLTQTHTARLVHSVISSRLDYCNSLFINLDRSNIYKLQKVQNAGARLVMGKRKHDSARNLLRELHWLNIDSRIIFKMLLLVHKIIRGKCSKNIILTYKRFNCRPNDYLILETPHYKTKYGRRTFGYNAPRWWNVLPLYMRKEEDTDVYKKQLKTILFDGTEELKHQAFKYD